MTHPILDSVPRRWTKCWPMADGPPGNRRVCIWWYILTHPSSSSGAPHWANWGHSRSPGWQFRMQWKFNVFCMLCIKPGTPRFCCWGCHCVRSFPVGSSVGEMLWPQSVSQLWAQLSTRCTAAAIVWTLREIWMRVCVGRWMYELTKFCSYM